VDVKIVPEPVLGAIPAGDGYRSLHAELTRSHSAATVRRIVRGGGEVLISFGLIVLLFAAYEIWGKTAIISDQQHVLNGQLNRDWGDSDTVPAPADPTPAKPAPAEGSGIGRLHIPKLHLRWVVVEGVSLNDIRYAPGHYPGTALPGELGNFAVAGHREPGIFWDLDKLKPGDDLIAETQDTWYVYQVYQSEIVTPHSVEVVAPSPDHIGQSPTGAAMTLTTCNPKWDNYQRLVLHAQLIGRSPHTQKPPELGG
jgi:sortase A